MGRPHIYEDCLVLSKNNLTVEIENDMEYWDFDNYIYIDLKQEAHNGQGFTYRDIKNIRKMYIAGVCIFSKQIGEITIHLLYIKFDSKMINIFLNMQKH